MKKLCTFCIVLLCFITKAKADHITGGEIYYTCSSNNGVNYTYNVTFKLFMRCNSGRQFYNPTIISVFDRGTNHRISDINVNLSSSETISLTDPDPCISDPPTVCYVVGYYNFTLTLPANANGYILSSQVNYRIAGINNLQKFYSNIGATYTAEIPGIPDAKNNSAKFDGNDLVVVCANNRFSYSFGATDPDGDKLHYSFCQAYKSSSGGNTVIPPPEPPYEPVPYGNSFNENSPLGGNVQIDPATGLITGIAPESGIYVVTVCVDEIRNGVVIARQRKDLQINIAPCKIAAAILQPEYMLCKDTKTINLVNLSSSPLIRTYFWELTNQAGQTVFTSTDPTVTYTFTDTGIYNIKLSINRGETCKDSTLSLARVYPGFVPGFSFSGICFTKPTSFTDLTTTAYGKVNSWNWTFGTVDTSTKTNPIYTFSSLGASDVQLIVTNTLGCRDTIVKPVSIVTAPPIDLAFKDTLICKGDPVTLHAEGSGNFTWSPNNFIMNSNTASPVVSPPITTAYNVLLDDEGCLNRDTVLVRVTDHVDLQMMPDTTICQGDTIQLRVISDAFTYSWSPAEQIIHQGYADPLAVTVNNTTYSVMANIGSCSTTGSVSLKTVPYPFVNAGNDTSICYNTSAQLHGSTNGSAFVWTPSRGLNSIEILDPVATPAATAAYILSATDTKGCPKPARDTVIVKVFPKITAFAGHDTTAVADQPLQLTATGGSAYLWSPGIGLSSVNIANPVAMYSEPFNSIHYKVVVFDDANCSDSAFVTVKVFITGPTIFIPTAFTPNGDGKNDVLRPIAAGIKQIDYFSIYNRWGQLVFTTQTDGKGWDGSINGVPQSTGVYVWMVKATDYKGKPYFKKGTVTLIK